jgi:hypothetical protein
MALRAYFRAATTGTTAFDGYVDQLLDAFDTPVAQGGVMRTGRQGPHYLMYSYDRGSLVFNGQLSATEALLEVAVSNSPAAARAKRLYTAAAAETKLEWQRISACAPYAYNLIWKFPAAGAAPGWYGDRGEDGEHRALVRRAQPDVAQEVDRRDAEDEGD